MIITANQVTLARIFLLPIPVALLIYGQRPLFWWMAFFIFVILGITDFIDGYMARREGPTKLGSLIDPVADKIFVASIFMSFSSLGILNPWIVALLLSREFLLTALRSSISIRKQTLKTSVLGKLKTVIQMGGAGTIFFTLMLKPFHVGVLSSLLSIPFLIAAFVYYLLNKKQPIWGVPVFMSLFIVGMCGFFTSKDFNLFLQLVLIISITWISAIDYIICSLKIFTKTGINEGDIIRLCWCVTQGILVAPIIYRYPYFIFPVLLTISLEFSLGGIDNVVAAEKRKFDYTPFLLSNLYGFLFVFSVKILPFYNIYISHLYLAIFLCFSSLLICSYYFAKNFDLFKRVI